MKVTCWHEERFISLIHFTVVETIIEYNRRGANRSPRDAE